MVERALALAHARLGTLTGRTGEPYADHCEGTIEILRSIMADEPTQAAAALCFGAELLPEDEIEREFGREVRVLVAGMRQVMRLRDLHRRASGAADGDQLETLRRMLLAMASDIRVVLLRLASRLQTLRWYAATRSAGDSGITQETLDVLAPLANRLGLWQLKWELEDLAFRFLWPDTYKTLARQLEEKRREREAFVADAARRVREILAADGVVADVSGRPKHIYSIWNKMRVKQLDLDEIQDLRGLRVIVEDVRGCYAALAVVHQLWTQVPEEYDDYIAKPKPNGYQSLHTVVLAEDGRPLEVQIRTKQMHRFAEYGVASHWRYKERSTGVAGAARGGEGQTDRIAWVRQLLAWQREVGAQLGARTQLQGDPAPGTGAVSTDEGAHIYPMTPQARVIELPVGSTPVDFAYHVHSDLGHRCRGARVDGHMVPLNTPLKNGQTVEIVSAKAGSASDGPSRDWLNPVFGYVSSPRARAKVRQWFHALDQEREIAAGRERIERTLQREGRTSLSFDELAQRLSQSDVIAMFVAVAREEIGQRALDDAVRGPQAVDETAQAEAADLAALTRTRAPRRGASDGGVLVVGIDLLMTQLARCCRPVPPDPIVGFVTKGRGVSVHRTNCHSFARMAEHAPERVLQTDWGLPRAGKPETPRGYAVDVIVRANDRPGLLRDVTEVFARDKLNVTAVQTLSKQQVANMQFTVEVPDVAVLSRALAGIGDVQGVFEARRK